MRARVREVLSALAFSCVLLLSAPASLAADFRREVIYQIVTDRFFDGDPSNNDPPQSAGLYDPTRADWRLYWGGDLEGVRQKLDYLAGMGVTAIWISPPADNINTSTPGQDGRAVAPYHGYHTRDFKRVEEHFGDAQNSWAAFDNLTAAAHAKGIKVIVDFSPNHTTFNNSGEFGALYDDGKFLGDYRDDANGYFHHEKYITDRYGRYNVQYQTLYDLADINQENPAMDAYLKDAARLFQKHGADGFRIDGVKHVPWGWQSSFVNAVNNSGDTFVFGEWYLEDPPARGLWEGFKLFFAETFLGGPSSKYTADPLYRDAAKLAGRSGMPLLNYPLGTAVREAFGPTSTDFSRLDSLLRRQSRDFPLHDALVNFVDNHDLPRLLTLRDDRHRLHAALAVVLTAPGIPCVYYGTEQYLHDDTSGGKDPYNRPMMNAFSTETPAYSLVARLSALRRDNPALAYGDFVTRKVAPDVYVYERSFFGNVVLVAINKSDSCSYELGGLRTALPPASHADYLGSALGGPALEVSGGDGEGNRVADFRLPAGAVAVWSYTQKPAAPLLMSVSPEVLQAGGRVTLNGENFGAERGEVIFGETRAAVESWEDGKVVVSVPPAASGRQQVRVVNASGQSSNAVAFAALTGEQIPLTFRLKNAPTPQPGENIFVVGDGFELGEWNASWDEAVGPMLSSGSPEWFVCASVPAGRTLNFKFVKIDSEGRATWEAGPNRAYATPAGGTAEVRLEWQY
jgi:glycosidase